MSKSHGRRKGNRLGGFSTLESQSSRVKGQAIHGSGDWSVDPSELPRPPPPPPLCIVLYQRIHEWEQFPIPELSENDVLLSVQSVGICGSDLKYWKQGVCGRFNVTSPIILGHETSGIVRRLGPSVRSLNVGDRVAVEPGVPCRHCALCRTGRYNLCPEVKFCATPPIHGTLAQYHVTPADFCFRLPDHVTLEEGAMLEPLAVAVYSCERGNVDVGNHVFISGAGPVGILTMMVSKVKGAAKVIVTDIDDHRLSVAKALGADHVINVKSRDARDIALEVERDLGSRPDVSFECSGSDVSFSAAIFATRSGGCVVLVGRGSLEPKVPIVDAATREVDIRGIFRYANCYPKALALVSSGLVDVKHLVTHRFSLVDSNKAFDTAYNRETKAIKVMIACGDQNNK